MTDRNTHPRLEDYPGWFPDKLPLWRRKWLQVTGTGVAAFVLGLAAAGSPSTEDMVSLQRAEALASDAADEAKAEATAQAEEDVLNSPKVLAALEEERGRVQKSLQQLESKTARQAKRIAKAQAQIRQLKRQKADAEAAAAAAQETAEAAQQAAAETQQSDPAPTASSGTDPRFNYCYEANAAGYGPYYEGQDPEYEWYRDADNDGMVCE